MQQGAKKRNFVCTRLAFHHARIQVHRLPKLAATWPMSRHRRAYGVPAQAVLLLWSGQCHLRCVQPRTLAKAFL